MQKAASLIICTATTDFKVLMLKKKGKGQYGGLAVFPGGSYSPADSWHDRGLLICALRETFEECGIHLSNPAYSVPMGNVRHDIFKDPSKFKSFCDLNGHPNLNSIKHFANWISPSHHQKRFDTHFYIATVAQPVRAYPDNTETCSEMWFTPSEFLKMHQEQEIAMLPPQFCILQELSKMSPNDLLKDRIVPPISPKALSISKEKVVMELPVDPLLNSRIGQAGLQLVLQFRNGQIFNVDWSKSPKL